ncbi:hypothetical protein K435DRAFT_879610 [Dendrothele bispora CBS 962.96]|uniref:Uncharacterized protein n=1 Tax=Dendrothele bispora (strain CBS 962.96) TaxID=1314807 RepID=A0A4S8KKZ6_DENBC|nr:hypothetical protein K435DRAFT_879610 [Dendrothele bispora CBS 962.96]
MASASSTEPELGQTQNTPQTQKLPACGRDSSLSSQTNTEGITTDPSPQATAIPTETASTLEYGSDVDENDFQALQATSNSRGRPLKNWTHAQSELLQTKTANFLACVETHKDALLGKTSKSAWPKPLLLCVEGIVRELAGNEVMKPLLNANLLRATGERPLSKEDEDRNKEQKQENMNKWKKNVKLFYKNKLHDWRKQHVQELSPPPKEDQGAYELLKKVFLANFGPRELFARENADDIRKHRDELVAQKPELKGNNGALYQIALSELWAVADQNTYVEKSKDQVSDLESVEAPCRSRKNLDARFDVDHEESWDSFSKGFLKWGEEHIPRRFVKPPESKPTMTIPKDSNGIPIFPNGKFSDVTVMRDVLTAFFKAVWFYSWPVDSQMAAIPWSRVTEHPEDYYDRDQLPKDKILKSPESMKKSDVVTWFEFFEECPKGSPPFTFLPKSEIEERLRKREGEALADLVAGDELMDDGSSPHASSPAPELDTDISLNPSEPVSTSTAAQGVEDPSFGPFPSPDTRHSIDPLASQTTMFSASHPSQSASTSMAHPGVKDQPSTAEGSLSSSDTPHSSKPPSHIPTQLAVSSVGTDVSTQVNLPLTIRVPPFSKRSGNTEGNGQLSTEAVEEGEDEAKGERKEGKEGKGKGKKAKGKKAKGRKTQESDQTKEGQTKEGEEAGAKRKRKVGHVEGTEEQGGQKRARAEGISATDAGSTVQPPQRRSRRLKKDQATGSA